MEFYGFQPVPSLVIPVVYLQGDENPDDHQQDFPYGVQEVPAKLRFNDQALSELAEKAKHWLAVTLIKIMNFETRLKNIRPGRVQILKNTFASRD
jgi:hypothetical protein